MEKHNVDFVVSFLEELHRRLPKDVRIATMLANLYTEIGQVDQSLRMDRKLARLIPEDPTVHYNLACSLALKNRKAEALRSLRTAITFGYNDFVWMRHDPDLANLQYYRGFVKLCDDLGIKYH